MPRNLKDIFDTQNVATLLDEEELAKIGRQAVEGYDGDEESRSEWKVRNKEGMKLAMQLSEKKDFPFSGASNVMYPLISIASIQFASRAYPNLIPGWDIVKAKVVGRDDSGEKANKARRVETHMNYQLNEEMAEWEEETDRLLTILPILGCAFKETYWSRNQKRNVSQYISPMDLVMHYKARDMHSVPRITKKYNLYPNEIVERIRSGMFVEFDIGMPQNVKDEGETYSSQDDYRPHFFLQQHTWLDLDGDGYSEPYILNIHYDTKKVVRIVPRFKLSSVSFNDRNKIQRIQPTEHYTKFTFLHSPDGASYDWGFGSLLSPINHTVNTTINQLLDAGTINNAQSGFLGRNITIGRGRSGGPLRIEPGEWMPVNYSGEDLRKNIVPLNEFMKEPSLVLFQLLGFMVSAGEKLSSVTELLMGEQTIQNEPATTSLARIEQGLKVFSSIHKRLHKSFGGEFRLLFNLNSEYLDPAYYYRIQDAPEEERQAFQTDYDTESCDISPSSNPEDVSNTQKMMKAQILFSLRGQGFNDMEISRRFLEALQVPDVQLILEAPPPAPDPKLVLESEKLDIERSKLEFEMAKFATELAEVQSRIILNIANAESKEAGVQIEQYKAQSERLIKTAEAKTQTPPAGVPGRAEGGEVESGKPYIVGEDGPEVIIPSSKGTVISRAQLKALGSIMEQLTGTKGDISSVFEGSYADPSFKPEEGLPKLTLEAIKAIGDYFIEGMSKPIKKTMDFAHTGEYNPDATLAATMMGVGAGWKGGLPAGTTGVGSNIRIDILGGIKSLQRSGQPRSMVSITELRNKLGMGSKEFDSEMLRLAREGKIVLHPHDFPGSLSKEAKDSLIIIDDPNAYTGKSYFNGVSIRPDENAITIERRLDSQGLSLKELTSGDYIFSGVVHPSLNSTYASDMPNMAAKLAEDVQSIPLKNAGKTGEGVVRVYRKEGSKYSTQNEYKLPVGAKPVMELTPEEARNIVVRPREEMRVSRSLKWE